MDMIYLYYDNPNMLAVQLDIWNAYAGVLRELPTVLLIDDGSPQTSAADIVRARGCELPIKVFRIREDIPWNFAGARNLGCAQAKGWIYVSDIDTLLFAEDAKVFFEDKRLQKNCFYIPKRVWLPDEVKAKPALVNLLFHKERYQELGGYDEDYAGHYGKEETDYFTRLKRVAKRVYRPDVVTRVMPPNIVRDAHTITERPRDKTRNRLVYARKQAAGFPAAVNPLRFSWERVL